MQTGMSDNIDPADVNVSILVVSSFNWWLRENLFPSPNG